MNALIAGTETSASVATKVVSTSKPSATLQFAHFTMGGDKPREGVNVANKDLDGDDYADLRAGNRQLWLVSAYTESALAAHRTDPLFSRDIIRAFGRSQGAGGRTEIGS